MSAMILLTRGEMRQVGEEDVTLTTSSSVPRRGRRDGLEVVEHAADLGLDVAAHQLLVAGSSGIWPDTHMVLPTRTAWE